MLYKTFNIIALKKIALNLTFIVVNTELQAKVISHLFFDIYHI